MSNFQSHRIKKTFGDNVIVVAITGFFLSISLISTFLYYQIAFPNLFPSWVLGDIVSMWVGGFWGMLSLDLAAVGWLRVWSHAANSDGQKYTAFALSVIDMIGSAISSFLYLMIATESIEVTPEMSVAAVYAITLISVINFLGVWAFKYFDSEVQHSANMLDQKNELAKKTAAKVILQIETMSDRIAGQVALHLSGQVEKEFLEQMMPGVTPTSRPSTPPRPSTPVPEKSKPSPSEEKTPSGGSNGVPRPQ